MVVNEEVEASSENLGVLSSSSSINCLSFSRYSFLRFPSGIYPIKSNKNSF